MNRQLMQDCLDVLRLVSVDGQCDSLIQRLKEELGKIPDDPVAIVNNYYAFHSKQMEAYFTMVKNSEETIKQLTVELIHAKGF